MVHRQEADSQIPVPRSSLTATGIEGSAAIVMPKPVAGAVGVLPRTEGNKAPESKQTRNKSKRKTAETSTCKKCGEKSPPRNRKVSIRWVRCDSCDFWFHNICVGLKDEEPSQQNWFCPDCDGVTMRPVLLMKYNNFVSCNYKKNIFFFP